MTAPLASNQLEGLLPALRHVAESVQKGGAPGREYLQLLLKPSELDEDWAIDELERWAKVLVAVRGATEEDKRDAAMRGLMLRGVPKANAQLAVETVAPAPPPPALPIQVNREAIGFGELKPGQEAQTTLIVSGGPGQVKVGSDIVTVQPTTFGPEETILTLTVQSGLEGHVLWDALILESGTERAELDLIACWTTPLEPSGEAPMLALRGKFVLDDLKEQNIEQRLGYGTMPEVIALNSKRALVYARGGAALFDLHNGESLWEIDCPAYGGALSPDGDLLALGGAQDLYLWDLCKGSFLQRLKGHTDRISSVAFSPDGQFLASGGRDSTVLLWEVSNGGKLKRLQGHVDSVSSVAFDPDGWLLASGSWDGTVRIWWIR